jgi:hypothetical protein
VRDFNDMRYKTMRKKNERKKKVTSIWSLITRQLFAKFWDIILYEVDVHILLLCWGGCSCDHMVVEFIVPIQSVPITTNVVSRIPLRRGVINTTLCDKASQWLVTVRWFSPVFLQQ